MAQPLPFSLRQATVADTEIIAQYNLNLALETENLRLDPAVVRPGVAAILQDATKGIYYVAESDGAVIGQVMITYEWSDWRNGNFWWLQSVYVQKEFRARGIFKALFAHVTAEAVKHPDVCGLRLYMESENHRARDVYRRLGLNETHYQVLEKLFNVGADVRRL